MKSLVFAFFATIAMTKGAMIIDRNTNHWTYITINYNADNKNQFNHTAYVDEINEAIRPLCKFYSADFEESIVCNNDMTAEDYAAVFANVSAIVPDDLKRFQRLQFGVSQNTLELNDTVFGGILFEELFCDIHNQGHLTFSVNDSQNIYAATQLFYVAYLTSYSVDFNKELEEVLKPLTNLKSLYIVKFHEAPTKLLVNLTKDFFDNFPQLTELEISNGVIVGVEAYTFWNTNMNYIMLYNTFDILSKEIPEHAFAHKDSSNETLTIMMNINGTFFFIDSLFKTDSLVGINRPTRLLLSGDIQQDYLPENVFKPFLLENENNMVGFYKPYVGLDCVSCKNYWVQGYNLTSQIDERCTNDKDLSDESNWPDCHGM